MFNASEMHRISSEREALSILPEDIITAIESAARVGKYSCDVTRKVSTYAHFLGLEQLDTLKKLGFTVGVKLENKDGVTEKAEDTVETVIYTIGW